MSKNPNPTTTLISDIGTYLQDTLLIGSLTVDLFLYTLPPDPIVATAIIALGGPRFITDLDAVNRPQFQILVRHTSHSLGLQKAEAIYYGLDRKTNILSSSNQGRIIGDHQPGPHFPDGNKNIIYSLNFSTFMNAQI